MRRYDTASDSTMIDRLQEIQDRLAAATPGLWRHVKDESMFMGTADAVHGSALEIRGRAYREWTNRDDFAPSASQVEPDAVFIAHAPEDIRYLLDALRVARETITWYESELPRSAQANLALRKRVGILEAALVPFATMYRPGDENGEQAKDFACVRGAASDMTVIHNRDWYHAREVLDESTQHRLD